MPSPPLPNASRHFSTKPLDVYVNVSHPAAVPTASPLPVPAERYGIAELAAEFGVTARAIRFYEGEGLIRPERQGMQRIYGRADRTRLAWILRAKNVGFSIADTREMLELYDKGDGRAAQRRVTLAKCRERVTTLTAQRADIDATITELESFIRQVEAATPKLREV